MDRIAALRAKLARARLNSGRRQAIQLSAASMIESLEVRRLLTTFSVTNTGDNGGVNPAVGAGTGTLRQALVDSNAATAATNTIDFAIPTTSAALYTITPVAALPTITQAVDIDGSSESGFALLPVIVLNGSSAGGTGLTIHAQNTTVSNLDIGNFRNIGVDINGVSGVTLHGNIIGANAVGTTATANGTGVLIEGGAQNNTIGVTGGFGNVLSGNTGAGLEIDGTATGPQTTGNTVEGNFIGTNANATASLANFNGIVIDKGAQGNTIGGTTASAINVISGAIGNNVAIQGTATGPQTSSNIVEGNLIGTDGSGNSTLTTGAAGQGVLISSGAQDNTIGGDPTLSEGNTISGNGSIGVDIVGTKTGPQTSGNIVAGNHIGIGATSNKAVPNSQDGVQIASGAQDNTVGEDSPAISNIISGNTGNGVQILGTATGPQTTGNIVEDNRIGTNDEGTGAVANGREGVLIDSGAASNTIGGSDGLADNVISGNTDDGIEVNGTVSGPITTGNNIEGNFIGIDANDEDALPNAGDGIALNAGVQSTTIGGTTAFAANVVSGNSGDGVHISGASTGTQTTGNVVEGNFIGTDGTGATAVANGINGVIIDLGAENNTIGGSVDGVRNVISGNDSTGVAIAGTVTGPQTSGNTVDGNLIGTDATGEIAIGNATGVDIAQGAENNTIGGLTNGAVNIISGNLGDGIVVNGQPTGPQTTGNTIESNLIGIDGDGSSALANGSDGIRVAQGAGSMTIGNGNVISGNGSNGIEISGTTSGPQTTGVTVSGNFIGTDLTGKSNIGNTASGVLIDTGAQGNTIGGITAAARNIITGNNEGVQIEGTATGPQTTTNTVEGNYIGTDVTGETFLGNIDAGVLINNGAQSNTIGGSVDGVRNVISANDLGVEIDGTTSGPQTSSNIVAGNFIGIDAKGATALANIDGIAIDVGASNNTIGGLNGPSKNVISGNKEIGVLIEGTPRGPQTLSNTVEGNFIGTNFNGTSAIANGDNGVELEDGASSNTIGGTTAAATNVISGNADLGVEIEGTTSGPQTISNVVSGNYIGTDLNEANAIPNGSGVSLDSGAQNNTIGGATAGSGNVISGNQLSGVQIAGSSQGDPETTGNFIQGNFIGTDTTAAVNLANGGDGVFIVSGTTDNTIGGSIPGAGNTIAFNTDAGVAIGFSSSDTTTIGNVVRLNSIFNNKGLGIDLGSNGVTPNQTGTNTGPNNAQNYPVLATAIVKTTTTTIQGSINSTANTPLVIDFYATPTLGPGSNAQGKTYLGSVAVTTDANGNSTFAGKITGTIPIGQFITATATTTQQSPIGNTSEFSAPIQVTGAAVIDTTPPTAALTTAPTDTTTSPYTFTITYSDNVAVSASTVPAASIHVSGPNGFDEIATLVTSSSSNGPTVTANYSVPGFNSTENGTYTVNVSPNAVTDTSGNKFAGGNVGTFNVAIAAPASNGSLSGSATAAATSYNLTTLGTGDWAAYGVGGNAGAFDHKATGGSQISNVTVVGSANYGAYVDSSRDVSWTDGTPLAKDAGDDGYIWANEGLGAGYSFTVPATTSSQTVYVYLGGYSSGSTLTATLSDGSATPYTVSFSGSGIYSDVVAITYKAASAGQTLKLSYLKSSNINGTNGSADLIAAWLDGAPTSPSIVTSPKSQTVAAGSTVTFTASATGTPNPSVQWEMSTNSGQTFTVIKGATSTTYSFVAQANENGDEFEAVFTNPQSYAVTSPATLTVTAAAPQGSISGTSSKAAASYNLTTVGTSDWAHWGTGNNAATFDHKATGGSQISNVTVVGSANYGAYSDPSRDVTWTDGTPQAKDGGDTSYIWANEGLGAGYSFTVPASTTTRTVYVYLGGYSSGSTLTATLSDGSASPYSVSFSGNAIYSDVVAITYKAASAGQTLKLQYVKSSNINGTSGSADLIAAWMA